MTNYEKYRDEIVKLNYTTDNNDEFCREFVNPKVLKSMGKVCSDISCEYCRTLMSIWLMDEYKEPEKPEVDWSKIPIDTKIYVKDNIYDNWIKRYFARYEKGKIYAWNSGYTSWSAYGEDDTTSWKYAKLAEEEKVKNE